MARYTTKELSRRTWPDYKRFFSQGNGWDHCGCTAYQGFHAPRDVRLWADKRDWNLNVKCDLVERRLAHGILVYDGTEPIGWCQFGPKGELPIRGNRRPGRLFDPGEERIWKVTCFCTHPKYRDKGIAGIALRAALGAIRRKGGGLIEAYPFARPKGGPETDERLARIKEWNSTRTRLLKAHGRFSEEVERHLRTREPLTEVVDGVGPVNAIYVNAKWVPHCGTVAMFEREGFKAVSILGVTNEFTARAALVALEKRSQRAAPSRESRPSRIVMQKTI